MDLLVYGHIYEIVKPKVKSKNINDVDWKDIKYHVYIDALVSKTMYWNNYEEFTKIFNDVVGGFELENEFSNYLMGVE